MALTPGIPTSFVPRQPTPVAPSRPQHSGTNLFLVVTLIIAAVSIVAAGFAYGYQRYLSYQLDQKAQLLATAQQQVNEDQVEEFVRLRDRLASGEELLSNQVVLSKFFDAIEDLTLQNVRFNSMNLTIAADGSAKLDIDGTARNFNTLAAQSNAFAGERGIKRAIFSGITLTDSRQVSFRLTADVDPRLIIAGDQAPAPAPITVPAKPAAPVATTTRPATTTGAGTQVVPPTIRP